MIAALNIIYLVIAAALALFALVNLLRAKTLDKAINMAILFVPLLLRALRIK
jgi:hypothetical protein